MKVSIIAFFLFFPLILFAQNRSEKEMKICFENSDYTCVIEKGYAFLEKKDFKSSQSYEILIKSFFEKKQYSDVCYFSEIKKEKYPLTPDEIYKLAISFYQLGKCHEFEMYVNKIGKLSNIKENEISNLLKICNRQLPKDKISYSLIDTLEVKEKHLSPILKIGNYIYYNFFYPEWATSCISADSHKKLLNGIYYQDITTDDPLIKIIADYQLMDIQSDKVIIRNANNEYFIGTFNTNKIEDLHAFPIPLEIGSICFTDKQDLYYVTKLNKNFNNDIYFLDLSSNTLKNIDNINTLGDEVLPYLYKGKLFFSSNFRPSINENFDLYRYNLESSQTGTLLHLNKQINSNEDELKILEITENSITIFTEKSNMKSIKTYKKQALE